MDGIKCPDDSGLGHDKVAHNSVVAEAIARMPKGKLHPTLLYVGDGIQRSERRAGDRPAICEDRTRSDHLLRKGEHPIHKF